MFLNKNNTKNTFIKSITVTLSVTVMLFLIFASSSCTRKKDNLADKITNRDSLPLLNTIGVESLVSDSGVIRYRILAGEWLIFDKAEPSYWSFEKKIHLERFDSLLRIDAQIDADTAYFYDKNSLWELRGNVKIVNLKGSTFTTNLLYWNQQTEKVYSDEYITIEDGDNIFHGIGFDADQRLEVYTIRKPTGIGYVDLNEAKKDSDSINN